MASLRVFLRGFVLATAFGLIPLPAVAQTPYFFSVLAQSIGPVTCSDTGISAPITGTVAFNLPPGPNNGIQSVVVNGGPPSILLETLVPTQGSVPAVSVIISIPSTPSPYTIQASLFPASGGAATGFGTLVNASCDAGGVGTLSISAQFVPTPASVPTLGPATLALLAVLVALTSAWTLARRRGARARR